MEVVLHAPFAGWLAPLGDVPDPVFGEGMMGEGVAIDPVEDMLRAPADGVIVAIPDSAHAVTLKLANGVDLLIHLGLETVALKGEGFRPLVTVGARVSTGDPLIAFDLDMIARRAKDMVTPIVAATQGAQVVTDQPGRMVAGGTVIARVIARVIGSGDTPAVAPDPAVSQRRSLLVTAPNGIHARPAARIVALLKPFAAKVTLVNGDRHADARSTVALMILGVRQGDRIDAIAAGADAATALDALVDFAAERFGDAHGERVVAPVVSQGKPVTAAPGVAVGQVMQFVPVRAAVVEAGKDVAFERAALAGAIARVAETLQGHELTGGAIAEAHRALLYDPALHEQADASIMAGKSAAFAWRHATTEAAAALSASEEPLLVERAADISDLEQQVVAVLNGDAQERMPTLPPDTVLIADDLLPSQFLALDRERLVGICTAAGGPTAHVAILAAGAGVPMLVAAGRGVIDIADGTPVILDADGGSLEVDPAPERLSAVMAKLSDRRAKRAAAVALAHTPCQTADGARIEVMVNLGSANETGAAIAAGAEGCGLLRTEFLFLDRATAPDEDEQARLYARIAAALGDRPLIIRTLDIGGDKPVAYLPRVAEDNPALGVRGIRLGLARPDLLATQLRAILRAVPGDQCRIMLPMIVDRSELLTARTMLDDAAASLGRTDRVALGVMIETPASAVIADQIAQDADFLSIGTNDLTQYTLAADRGNAGVAAMGDACHPAVLRLIAQTVRGGAKHGRWTGVCGGLASDPRAAVLLVGLGVTELSVVAAAIPAVKQAVRATTLEDARVLAERACAMTSAAEVRAMLEPAA